MADSTWASDAAAAVAVADAPRHPAVVRATHWITALAFFALLVSGVEILISHPRFYWGETGNVSTPALFQLPIPASRGIVKTNYGYVLPDQNGWSRSLHFQSAWLAVLAGLLYGIYGFLRGHFKANLLPSAADRATFVSVLKNHMRFKVVDVSDPWRYNVLQRLAYLSVVFGLFPLMIWTGLAMSPGVTSAFPGIVTVLGGHQSARTIHFFSTLALVLFVVGHVAMVCLAGFIPRMRAMITGQTPEPKEQP